ncbi:glycosyltransferase [Patescibacteria group bacterium]
MKKKYTFIINTYPSKLREKELIKTINSILNQSYKNFDVLLVENFKDTNKIENIVHKIGQGSNKIKIINSAKKKLSYLFDIGWRSTDSEYLTYVADDVELEKNWLETANKEFDKDQKREIGVVTGPIISSCYPAGEMHRLFLISQKNALLKFLIWPYLHFAMEDKVLKPGNLFKSGAYSLGAALEEAKNYKRQEIDLATTSSMCIRKEVMTKIDGFDQRFNFNHADGDLFIRIKKAGYKIIFNPKVVSHHHLRMGPSRNAYIIGLDTGMFYRKHVKPSSVSSLVGAVLNILVLNSYWIYNAVRTRNLNQLRGITGFLEGVVRKT